MIALLLLTIMQGDRVEVEPITCWWRTGAAAVRVGEPFDVVLTCSLLQTEAARVIVDESRLDPAVVQLPPFEVFDGKRAAAVNTASRRFIQFQYRLRALADNVFASELPVPPVEIPYRVESRASGGETVTGRDLTYALPPLTTRVMSLVPNTAEDIREAPIATFGEIETLRARGTMLRAAAVIALTLGILTLAAAAIGLLRRQAAPQTAGARTVSPTTVLARVRSELGEVQQSVARSGWTEELASRALAAIRVAAAHAARKPVTQRAAVGRTVAAGTGELIVARRRGAPAIVSATVTAVDDDTLGDAIVRFTAACFGRQTTFGPELDEALAAAIARTDQLLAERPWLERIWRR